jgi:hypothetical protein
MLSTSLKLKNVASQAVVIVNGAHRPAHKVGQRKVEAGLALTASPALKAVM